jgi:hypothetical protein
VVCLPPILSQRGDEKSPVSGVLWTPPPQDKASSFRPWVHKTAVAASLVPARPSRSWPPLPQCCWSYLGQLSPWVRTRKSVPSALGNSAAVSRRNKASTPHVLLLSTLCSPLVFLTPAPPQLASRMHAAPSLHTLSSLLSRALSLTTSLCSQDPHLSLSLYLQSYTHFCNKPTATKCAQHRTNTFLLLLSVLKYSLINKETHAPWDTHTHTHTHSLSLSLSTSELLEKYKTPTSTTKLEHHPPTHPQKPHAPLSLSLSLSLSLCCSCLASHLTLMMHCFLLLLLYWYTNISRSASVFLYIAAKDMKHETKHHFRVRVSFGCFWKCKRNALKTWKCEGPGETMIPKFV